MKTGFDGIDNIGIIDQMFYINEILFGACFLSLLPNVTSLMTGDLKLGFNIFFSVFFPVFVLVMLKNIFKILEQYLKGDLMANTLRFILLNITIIKFIILVIKS